MLWLNDVRRSEIIDVVHTDMRTSHDRSTLLGVPRDRIFNEVIGGGQADFDEPWEHLSTDERVLLYAFFNQKGHLQELAYAFELLFGAGGQSTPQDPIVIDLGCGPFTGGLALANELGKDATFTYIGVDRAPAMHRLGERLATAAVRLRGMATEVERTWVTNLESLSWPEPPRWRPVIVIVSYLLASPTVDPGVLMEQLELVLKKLGRGSVTVLYTNSTKPSANVSFPVFQSKLEAADFLKMADGTGSIPIDTYDGVRDRTLRYALFHRRALTTLKL